MSQPPTANPPTQPGAAPPSAVPVSAEPQTMWDQIFSGLVPGSIGLPTLPQTVPQPQGPTQSAFGALGGETSPMSPDAVRALTEGV